MPHHIELQTYDIPDAERGRPTGAVGLRSAALYCVGDGHGNRFVATKGAEWLRIIWPSHAAEGGGSATAITASDALRLRSGRAREPGDDDDDLDLTLAQRRPVVWLHNRSPEFTKGRKPVLRPLRAGPTPHIPPTTTLDDDAATASTNKKPSRFRWRARGDNVKKHAALARKVARRHAKEQRDADRRKRLLGDQAAFMCSLRSLNRGTDVVLWARPKWYRTVPALPATSRLKARAIPEIHGAVLGEIRWGEAVLVFGRSGDCFSAPFKTTTTRGSSSVVFVEPFSSPSLALSSSPSSPNVPPVRTSSRTAPPIPPHLSPNLLSTFPSRSRPKPKITMIRRSQPLVLLTTSLSSSRLPRYRDGSVPRAQYRTSSEGHWNSAPFNIILHYQRP